MENVKFTIVTVCYNAEKTLPETMRSVYLQSCRSYEYLVIDGKSTDHSGRILEQYAALFKAEGISCFIVSEPDGGIYDAMNKAAEAARGEWIYFLNAGDTFYSRRTLEQIRVRLNTEDTSVLYGNINAVYFDQKRISKPRSLETFSRKLPFCHQGVFTRTELLKKNKFDMSYRIAADYDLYLRLYLKDCPFRYEDITIADYRLDGLSGKNGLAAYLESSRIKRSNSIQGDCIPKVFMKIVYHFWMDRVFCVERCRRWSIERAFRRKLL